ncbi:thioesterase II family protein [Actinophytocola sp.]|uniref:thioesterase II family protein n=1 Tax=Actinophytocola sp. TaxID=1872138 RepID=UPI002ED012BA
MPDRWSPRVFCFPYAGGNPDMFSAWQSDLESDAVLVGMPIRGGSIDEVIDASTAAVRAATKADRRPVYLFGHSLGALIAFEVARRLDDLPELRHLVASGLSAPSLLPSRRVRELARLRGREFAEALGFFGGLPPEILADEDVLELLLPGVIADFRLAAGYRYRPAPPLAVDVSLINGREDPHVGPAQLEGWQHECVKPPARHWVDGGHFYLDTRPAVVIELLRELVHADNHVELI